MAFEINNFSIARKENLEISIFSVECNVMAGTNVSKVLSLSVRSNVLTKEVLNGVINYSGVIDTKIVFMNENGELDTVCSTCPYSSKFESEIISNGNFAYISNKVLDYDIDNISGESIKISVSLEQSGFVLSNKDIKTIKNNDTNVCCKNEEISIIRFIGSACENVEVTSEINIRDKIKKILLTESNVVLKSVESGVNFVTVSGDVCNKITYLTENDKFESGYVYDSFKEEVEIDNVTRDSLVEGSAFVRQDKVSVDVVEDEKGCKVQLKVPVQVMVCAYNEENISVIKDLYSIQNEINVTTESFNMSYVSPLETVEGKIEGQLNLGEDKPRVDKILFNGGNNVTVTNSYIKDGEVFVEGIAKTSVVYLNDEDNSLNSAQIDVPFTISDKINNNCESKLFVDAIVCDVDVVVKKGRELLYDAKVKAYVNQSYDKIFGVITEATIKDEYPQKDYAMEVLFAKAGQDLWDIAKNARVKEEQIVAQNSDMIFPLDRDTSLILYYQKV